MVTTVEAVPTAEFEAWLADSGEAADVHPGQVAMENYGCLGCHSLDGSKLVGPSFLDIFGRDTVIEVDGVEKTIKADREYLLRAINDPNAEIVKGFPPAMPPYEGAISEEELNDMLDFLEGGGAPAGPDGMQLIEDNGCLGCHSLDGSKQVGPTLKGIFGRQVTVEKDGTESTVTSDRDYLKRAIVNPEAEIVKGFPPAMPAYDWMAEEEVEAVIDTLETLK